MSAHRIKHGREPRLAAMRVEPGCFCRACVGERRAPRRGLLWRGFTLGDILAVIVAALLIIGLVSLGLR